MLNMSFEAITLRKVRFTAHQVIAVLKSVAKREYMEPLIAKR